MAAIESLTTDAIIAMINKGAQFPLVTGNLVALNDAVAMDVSSSASVTITIKNTGTVTMAAGLFTFEASLNSTDGVNGDWYAVQGVRSNANTIESVTVALALVAGAQNAYAWTVSTDGVAWFRIRCSTAVTASAIASVSAYRTSLPSEPIPAIAAHAVTGSGTFLTSPSTNTGYALVTTASTNGALIVAGTKILNEITISNLTAAIIYVKLYNKATAPTVGTDVPLVTIPVPVGGLVALEFGAMGKRFNLGLGIAVTGAAAATDTTAVAVGAQISASYV
jgi:hypothetical protein